MNESKTNEFGNAQKLTFTETANAIYHYKLDGAVANEGDFTVEVGSPLHFIVTGGGIQNNKDVFIINAFTTLQKESDFATLEGIPLAKLNDFENTVVNYAQSSGAIAIEEATGEVPQFLIDFIETTAVEKSVAFNRTTIYTNNCSGTGTGGQNGLINQIGGYKFRFVWPWNDNIERFHNAPFQLLVLNKVYRNPWFGNKLLQTWLPATQQMCFEGPLADVANEATSWIAIL